jgi:hypothetical protein
MRDKHVVEEPEIPLAPSFARLKTHFMRARVLVLTGKLERQAGAPGYGAVAERARVKIVKHSQQSFRAGKMPKTMETVGIVSQGGKNYSVHPTILDA